MLNRFDNDSAIHCDNKRVLEAMTGLEVLVCETQGDLDVLAVKKFYLQIYLTRSDTSDIIDSVKRE